MKTVKLNVKSDFKKASRAELFVRILWCILTCIVLFFFSIVAVICIVIHWLYILITGKRSKSLNGVMKSYLIYKTSAEGYLYMLTDERSPIIPNS